MSSFQQLLAAKVQQGRAKSAADMLQFERLKGCSSDFWSFLEFSTMGLDMMINQS